MPLASILAIDSVSSVERVSQFNICAALAKGETVFATIPGCQNSLGAHVESRAEKAIRELRAEYKLLRRADRAALLAALSASLCAAHLLKRCELPSLEQMKIGVVAGSSRGTTQSLEENLAQFISTGKTPVLSSPITTFGNIATSVAQTLKLSGPTLTISSTCTSGLMALLQAALLVSGKQADLVLAVGAEAPLTPFTLAQMEALGICPTDWSDPHPTKPLCSDPLSKTGLALGESGVSVAVGTYNDSAIEHEPLCFVNSLSAAVEQIASPTGITENGEALQKTMTCALNQAKLAEVDLILAHAPGTRRGDAAELTAINEVFKEKTPVVYSPKWLLGHTFGASGLLSLCLAIELFQGGELSKLPYPSESNVKLPIHGSEINHILINAAGFGGLATSVIVSRPSALMEKL